MCSSKDFERLFIRYKGEGYLRNESSQSFYLRNNDSYNPFEKWYKARGCGSFRMFFTAGNGEDKGDCSVKKEEAVREVRVLVNLCVNNGLHCPKAI